MPLGGKCQPSLFAASVKQEINFFLLATHKIALASLQNKKTQPPRHGKLGLMDNCQ